VAAALILDRAREAAGAFALPGEVARIETHRGGHIHDSFLVTVGAPGAARRFLLQYLNTAVFRDPVRLAENVERVTRHIAARVEANGAGDLERRCLTLLPARAGGTLHRDSRGAFWRAFVYIEGARSETAVRTPSEAEAAGRAFGRFQELVSDLGPPRLHEVLPGFHDTPKRIDTLVEAARTDPRDRLHAARRVLDLVLERRDRALERFARLRRGSVPERVVHNDTKLSNVLLDAASGAPLCVVDLDTVMPGIAPLDFGDMVRSMATRAAEDERNLDRVEVEMPLFDALARGYLEGTRTFLTEAERRELVSAGILITFEQAVRFLTDHLLGDVYYKIDRPGHNLDRARAQLALLASIEGREEAMERTIETLASSGS